MTVRYGQGEWFGIVRDQGIAALAPDVPTRLVEALWQRLEAGGVPAVIDILTSAFGTAVSSLPAFAVATVEGGSWRVAVRGAVEMVVEDDGGGELITGAGVTTWVERVVPAQARMRIVTPSAGTDERMPIISGVVRVSVIEVPARAVVTPSVEEGAAVAASQHAPSPHAASPHNASRQSPALVASPSAGPGARATAAAPVPSVTPSPPRPSALTPIPSPVPAIPATPESAADTFVGVRTPATRDTPPPPPPHVAPVAPTAVVPEATEAEPERPEETWSSVAATAAPEDDDEQSSEHTLIRDTEDGSDTDIFGDHDGRTITLAEARASRGLTVRGRALLSTGRTVAIDRLIVVGRRPRATRASIGHLPELITVPSPEQDISRSHVEIRPEGESVLVTDLNTTNGTTLMRPGGDPVRLHPDEPTLVLSGDVLDLGDGITITFEGIR